MSAVGGADLDQLCAGAAHDLGHTEGAADLYQFTPRHNSFAALGERIEHKEHGTGIVVDHSGIFGAGQFTQELTQNIVAIAAPAGAKIVFESDGVAHRG